MARVRFLTLDDRIPPNLRIIDDYQSVRVPVEIAAAYVSSAFEAVKVSGPRSEIVMDIHASDRMVASGISDISLGPEDCQLISAGRFDPLLDKIGSWAKADVSEVREVVQNVDYLHFSQFFPVRKSGRVGVSYLKFEIDKSLGVTYELIVEACGKKASYVLPFSDAPYGAAKNISKSIYADDFAPWFDIDFAPEGGRYAAPYEEVLGPLVLRNEFFLP